MNLTTLNTMNSLDTLGYIASVGEYAEIRELKYASRTAARALPHMSVIVSNSTHYWSLNDSVMFQCVVGQNGRMIKDGVAYRITIGRVARTEYRYGRPFGIHIQHGSSVYHNPPKFSYQYDTMVVARGYVFNGYDIHIKLQSIDNMFRLSDEGAHLCEASNLEGAIEVWKGKRKSRLNAGIRKPHTYRPVKRPVKR